MNNFAGRVRSRKLWDKHGSYLILVMVVALAWNGGSEWRDWKTQQLVESIVKAGVEERNSLRARLKEVNLLNQEMARNQGPTVAKANEAVIKADAAVSKADAAVDKADKAVDKADTLLNKDE